MGFFKLLGSGKQTTTWTANDEGQIVKAEEIEEVQGVVVDDVCDNYEDLLSFLRGCWRAKNSERPAKKDVPLSDNNGRVYNAAEGTWQYTADRNNGSEFGISYVAVSDSQGTVPQGDIG